MNRYVYLLTFVVCSLCGRSLLGENVDNHIYWIKVARSNMKTAELTGFKVKGRNGIYTALHGIVGGTKITGFTPSDKSNPGYKLELAEVDIDRDIAYLVASDDKQKLASGGLSLGVTPQLEEFVGKSVKVVGYPMGINLLTSTTSLTVRKPAAASLGKITDEKTRVSLAKRNSPALTTNVLSIDGNLLPGHSGAPILDEDQSVIAVGNGGLDVGRIGWGWAIPFHDIQLVPMKNNLELKKRLDKLAEAGNQFAFSCVLDDVTRAKLAVIRTEIRSVIVSTDGGPVMAFQMTPKQAMTAQVARLKEVLELMKQGKADKLDPVDELERLNKKLNPLAVGTAVEVLEVEQQEGGVEKLQAFPIIRFPGNGGNNDPFQQLGNILGDVAQQVNVKVKVLDGPQKGKLLWIHRNAIRRETVLKSD